MKKVLSIVTLFAVLAAGTGCNVSQFVSEFDSYSAQIVPAAQAVLALLQFFGVAVPFNAQKVGADVTAAQTLVADFAKSPASAQPGIRSQIMAEEAVLNQDLAALFTVAQVSDTRNQAKITVGIQLLEALIAEGFALIPNTTSAADLASRGPELAKFQSKGEFVHNFNTNLESSSGNRGADKVAKAHLLHNHSKVVRLATFGLVN